VELGNRVFSLGMFQDRNSVFLFWYFSRQLVC